MARTTKKAPAKAEPKPEAKVTRKRMTDEERIAKLEADLKAAREKREKRANKGRDEALAKRDKLVARIAVLQKQVDAINAEFPDEAAEGDDTGEDTEV